MSQRDSIISEIQKATSLQKQAELVSALDALDRATGQAHAQGRAWDAAGAVARETLRPVAVHERSTAATDWLGDFTASEDYAQAISAEAAMWFGRTSPEVRADLGEFREQAHGFMRRQASAYGEDASAAYSHGMAYLAFLRTQAASGLPQVQQLVDSFENPAQTQMPQQAFDNFAPPVHPINEGVVGTETSERAPLLQQIEQGGSGMDQGQGARPSHHEEVQDFSNSYSEVPPGPPEHMQAYTPTVAISHAATLDDFRSSPRGSSRTASLSDDMDFDSPVRVHEDGSTSREPHHYVPHVEHDDEHDMLIDGIPHGEHPDWEAATTGSSGQHGYGGPVMHPSEYIGGGLERRIKESPGVYAATSVEDPDDQDNPVGWTVLRHKHAGRREAASRFRRQAATGSQMCVGCSETFLRVQGAMATRRYLPQANDQGFSCTACGYWTDFASGQIIHPKEGGRWPVEAASRLDQVQQTVDSFENPDPTPLPTEVAFPWEIDEHDEGIDERSDHKAAKSKSGTCAVCGGGMVTNPHTDKWEHSEWKRGGHDHQALPKRQSSVDPEAYGRRAAFVAGLAARDPRTLTDAERGEVVAFTATLQRVADQWSQSGPQSHGPGPANSPATTPDLGAGAAEGRADWEADASPTFADASSHVPDNVRAYSEAYGEEARTDPDPSGDGAQSGQLPPGAGGFDGGYQTHAASLSVRAFLADRGLAPTPAEPVRAREPMRVSAAFVTPLEESDKDFTKGYRFAKRWTSGSRIVMRGSAAFEAGLYAGISDNPGAQDAWVDQHHAAAERYGDSYTERIRQHEEFTQRAASTLSGMRVRGSYLESTAATSSELDTMDASASPSPTGQTPINGPGTRPPLADQTDPAAPGGPAPYNAAPPFGSPVAPMSPAGVSGRPNPVVDTTVGGPVDQAAVQHLSPQTRAFRQRVEAGRQHMRRESEAR